MDDLEKVTAERDELLALLRDLRPFSRLESMRQGRDEAMRRAIQAERDHALAQSRVTELLEDEESAEVLRLQMETDRLTRELDQMRDALVRLRDQNTELQDLVELRTDERDEARAALGWPT